MNLRFIGAVQPQKDVWVVALLTDQKEILTGREGEIVGNRYRISKIGEESVELQEVATGRQRRLRMSAGTGGEGAR